MESLDLNEKYNILIDVVEDLPIEFIRQVKINYDSRYISKIFIFELNKIINNHNDKKTKIIFNELKYDNYKMEDIYYLISKIVNILIANNYKVNYYPNYKKDGFNLFINSLMFSFYYEIEEIIIEFM